VSAISKLICGHRELPKQFPLSCEPHNFPTFMITITDSAQVQLVFSPPCERWVHRLIGQPQPNKGPCKTFLDTATQRRYQTTDSRHTPNNAQVVQILRRSLNTSGPPPPPSKAIKGKTSQASNTERATSLFLRVRAPYIIQKCNLMIQVEHKGVHAEPGRFAYPQ
jgi:hypothetical protein